MTNLKSNKGEIMEYEINYLGLMLTATKPEDKTRLESIIERLKEIRDELEIA